MIWKTVIAQWVEFEIRHYFCFFERPFYTVFLRAHCCGRRSRKGTDCHLALGHIGGPNYVRLRDHARICSCWNSLSTVVLTHSHSNACPCQCFFLNLNTNRKLCALKTLGKANALSGSLILFSKELKKLRDRVLGVRLVHRLIIGSRVEPSSFNSKASPIFFQGLLLLRVVCYYRGLDK